MNNKRHLRDSDSHLRGSAKNLKELGSLRDSSSFENGGQDFSIKKNKRVHHGVQLQPLHHKSTLKDGNMIFSQNRASIPLSHRVNQSTAEVLANG